MTPATISLLLPTYRRPAELRRTLEDVCRTVAQRASCEVLVWLPDDADSHEVCEDFKRGPVNFDVWYGSHVGYRGLPRAINTLAGMATGDWLFVFADDVTCDTPGWDDVIRRYDHTRPTLLTCDNDRHNIRWFPIISRPAYEAMGVVTLSQFHDEWLDRVFWRAAPDAVHQAIPACFTDRIIADEALHRLSPAERLAFDLGVAHASELLRAAVEKG